MTKDASFKRVVRRHAEETGRIVEGAAILRFLEREDYPAERLAVRDAVSDFDGSAVLVTRFVDGAPLPDGAAKFAMTGELLGRLHALPHDDSVSRPGGASGEDPRREGHPRQDLLAALSFLDAIDTKVPAADRDRFERLRAKVRSADDGHGLPEALLRTSWRWATIATQRQRAPCLARFARSTIEAKRCRADPDA
jgi:hypothetical protein